MATPFMVPMAHLAESDLCKWIDQYGSVQLGENGRILTTADKALSNAHSIFNNAIYSFNKKHGYVAPKTDAPAAADGTAPAAKPTRTRASKIAALPYADTSVVFELADRAATFKYIPTGDSFRVCWTASGAMVSGKLSTATVGLMNRVWNDPAGVCLNVPEFSADGQPIVDLWTCGESNGPTEADAIANETARIDAAILAAAKAKSGAKVINALIDAETDLKATLVSHSVRAEFVATVFPKPETPATPPATPPADATATATESAPATESPDSHI